MKDPFQFRMSFENCEAYFQYKVNAAWFPKILVKRWLFYKTSKIKPTTKIQQNGILYLYIKTVFNNLILMLMNIELNFWLDNPIDYQ